MFVFHRSHYVWFDEYNYRLYIKYKHTTGSIILWKYYEGHIHDSDLLKLIPCEIDIKYTPFIDTTIIIYDIDLPPSRNKVVFNLLNHEDFIIPYITDTIPNSPYGHQLPSQAKRNVWMIAINGEDPIKSQFVLDELNCHKTPRVKSNIKISLCRRKSYQRTDIEDIHSRFYQVIPVVHILKFVSQRNLPHQRKLMKVLAVLRDNSGKKSYIFNMTRTKMPAFFQIQSQSNTPLKEKNYSVH